MIDWLAQHGPSIVTVAFFVLFVGVALWAFLPSNRKKLEAYGQIPLKEHEDV